MKSKNKLNIEIEATKEISHYELRIEYKSGITEVERYDTHSDLQDRFEALLITVKKRGKIKDFRAFIVFEDNSFMETLNEPMDRWLP